MLGMAEFSVRGQSLTAVAQTYRFFLLQRVHDLYDALGDNDKVTVDAMLDRCGLAQIMDIRLDRVIGRADNLEIWL